MQEGYSSHPVCYALILEITVWTYSERRFKTFYCATFFLFRADFSRKSKAVSSAYVLAFVGIAPIITS